MDRKYTIIFILVWLIISIIIALFFFLPFIFIAIAVLLILLAYDFYQKSRPDAKGAIPGRAQPTPAPLPSTPVPDTGAGPMKERETPPVPEGIPKAAEDLKKKGNEFFRQNKFEDAIRCYASAVDIDPGYIDAWNNLGMAFLKTGNVDLARRCNEKVKELKSAGPAEPAREPVSSPPVVPEAPVQVQHTIVPEEKPKIQKQEVPETGPDTISFLRDVARPPGYGKKEQEYKEESEAALRITREIKGIPDIPADMEPDWKNLFSSASEIQVPGVKESGTTTGEPGLKGARAETPAYDRVIPPLERREEQVTNQVSDIIKEPENFSDELRKEETSPVYDEADTGAGTVPAEPEIIPPDVQAHAGLPVPAKEDILPGPAQEEPGISLEEIPVHVTVPAATGTIPVPAMEEELFPDDFDIEIPGHETLIPPEIEGFPEEISEFLTPGPESIPVIPGEEALRAVDEKIQDTKEKITGPGVSADKSIPEVPLPREGPPVPVEEEKTGTTEVLMPQKEIQLPDTAVPFRKSEGPSVAGADTAVRKPKAERFPQEKTGGIEPYEQMVAHGSLSEPGKAAGTELQMPGEVPEKKILIVDDNDYIVTGLEHMLRKNGYLTASCNTGQDALNILGNTKIDAVLLDLNMEPMSGWHLLGIMRSDVRMKEIPVIIFSAKETLHEEASRTPLKISAFLSKPVNTRLLLSELEKIFTEDEFST